MKKQLQLMLTVLFMALTGLTTYGQQRFTDNNIEYEITSSAEVKVVGSPGNATEITIPKEIQYQNSTYPVTAIDGNAFNNQNTAEANKLTSVTFAIPSHVRRIGTHAFAHNNLTSVNIPNSVTAIEDAAFAENHLTEVTIPGSVTRIDQCDHS